jgi:hypothetical protein
MIVVIPALVAGIHRSASTDGLVAERLYREAFAARWIPGTRLHKARDDTDSG